MRDLNTLALPEAAYDVIAVKGTLHHLVQVEAVIEQIYRALKPGGLLWVSDSTGSEKLLTVLAAGALTFFLPTQVPYRDKLRALVRFRARAAERLRMSIEAEGLSPFEGAGRAADWARLIEARFVIERRVRAPAFTGYVTAQLRAPDAFALPLLTALRAVDLSLVRLGLLRSTGLILYARKKSV